MPLKYVPIILKLSYASIANWSKPAVPGYYTLSGPEARSEGVSLFNRMERWNGME